MRICMCIMYIHVHPFVDSIRLPIDASTCISFIICTGTQTRKLLILMVIHEQHSKMSAVGGPYLSVCLPTYLLICAIHIHIYIYTCINVNLSCSDSVYLSVCFWYVTCYKHGKYAKCFGACACIWVFVSVCLCLFSHAHVSVRAHLRHLCIAYRFINIAFIHIRMYLSVYLFAHPSSRAIHESALVFSTHFYT